MARLISTSRYQHTPGDVAIYGGVLLLLTLLHLILSLFGLFTFLSQSPYWYGTIVVQIAFMTVPSFGGLIIRDHFAARSLRWGFLIGFVCAVALCVYLHMYAGKSYLQSLAEASEPITVLHGVLFTLNGGSIFPLLFWVLIPCGLCAFFVRLRTASFPLAIASAIFAICAFTLTCLTLHPFLLQWGQTIYWPLWIADYILLVRIYAAPFFYLFLLSIGAGIVGATLAALFRRLFGYR
jgi:predicted permease